MKKKMLGALPFVAAVVVLRRFGPALRERAMRNAMERFNQLPEDFPPRRIIRGLDEIRQQNAEILRKLDERTVSTGKSGG